MIDPITTLPQNTKSKLREGTVVVCAVLGAALASALRGAARSHQEMAVIKSLQVQVQLLQAQVANLEGQLGKKRNQNSNLIGVLQKELVWEPTVCLGHVTGRALVLMD